MAENENKIGKALPFLLGGVAVGAALGVLFAPKSGKETRADIAAWLKEKREKSGELLAKFREKIPAKKEQVLAAFRAGKEAFRGNEGKKEAVSA